MDVKKRINERKKKKKERKIAHFSLQNDIDFKLQLNKKKKKKIKKKENDGESHVIFMEMCFYIILASVENFYKNLYV